MKYTVIPQHQNPQIQPASLLVSSNMSMGKKYGYSSLSPPPL